MSAPGTAPEGRRDPQRLRVAADRILEQHEAGDRDGARAGCDALEADASDDDLTHPVVRESVFTARFQRAVIETEEGDLEAALAGYLSAAALPVDPDDPDQTHELAMALLNAGICWSNGGDPAAALATWDDLLDRVGDATDPVTAEQVTKARVNRGVALLDLDRPQAAADAAAEVLELLGAGTEPIVAEQRVMALRLQARAQRDLARPEEAAVTLAAAEPLGDVDDEATRTQVVVAIAERAEVLAELGRADEAIAVLEATVARFDGDPDVGPIVVDLRAAEAELLEATGDVERAAQVRAAMR